MSDIIEAVEVVLSQGGESTAGTFIDLLTEQGFHIVAAAEIERLEGLNNGLVDLLRLKDAKIERLRHKPEIGGPPCPTCGFVITSKKAEPSRYEDEE